jgi:CRISPR-associated protein Cmr6
MMFQVKKDLTRKELERSLCRYGEVAFCSLKPDYKNPDAQFGQADFIEIRDTAGLEKYLKSVAKNFSQKASKQDPNRRSRCERKEQRTNASKAPSNLGRSFYMDEDYGKSLIDENVRTRIKDAKKLLHIEGACGFSLRTLYPGLLIGAGYAHPKLKENDEDFQLGFFFDHTTGLPVIPGSSIKGALRSLLPIDGDVNSKREYVKALYKWDDAFIDDLCARFEDGKTVFFDAYIEVTDDEKGRIFAEDYITSHFSDEPMGAFKDPNPVRFIKIRPGVTFRFQFGIDDERVLEAFKTLLIDHGVGAKTNVGYGAFEDVHHDT